MQKNHGKGLTGFIFGLLLATLIIGAVLFFLNRSPSGFRQPDPPPEVVSQPEELRPRGSQVRTPPVQKPQDGGLADPWGDIVETDASEPVMPPVVPPETEEAPRPEPQPIPKPERTGAESKPRPTAESKPQPREPRPEPKPTPEQILNSGSVEKAREQVRREQQDRRAANRAAEGGRVVVQMGSFNNAEAADAQRAKLAMLGVNARLSRTTGKDGQTVYRIQSGRLSREEAQRLTDKLRQNNIDSLTRSAE